jgi:hypothetical protein
MNYGIDVRTNKHHVDTIFRTCTKRYFTTLIFFNKQPVNKQPVLIRYNFKQLLVLDIIVVGKLKNTVIEIIGLQTENVVENVMI